MKLKWLFVGSTILVILSAYGGLVVYKNHMKKQGYIYESEINTITSKELIDRAISASNGAGKGNRDADEILEKVRRIIDSKAMNEPENVELMYALAIVANENEKPLRMMKVFALATDDKFPNLLTALYLNYINSFENALRAKARDVAMHIISSNAETLDKMIAFRALRQSTVNRRETNSSDYILEMGDIVSLEEKLISSGMIKGREDEIRKLLEEDKKIASLEELRPKLEILENQKNELESTMSQFIETVRKTNAKSDELLFGIRHDGTRGYMTMEEAFWDRGEPIKIKMIEINEIRKQMGIIPYSNEELAKYDSGLMAYLSKEGQADSSVEDRLLLNGIARDAGCTAETLLEIAKTHPTFANQLKSIMFARRMHLKQEKQFKQIIPRDSRNEIQLLVQTSKMPPGI